MQVHWAAQKENSILLRNNLRAVSAANGMDQTKFSKLLGNAARFHSSFENKAIIPRLQYEISAR